jgi:hypothetical protein
MTAEEYLSQIDVVVPCQDIDPTDYFLLETTTHHFDANVDETITIAFRADTVVTGFRVHYDAAAEELQPRTILYNAQDGHKEEGSLPPTLIEDLEAEPIVIPLPSLVGPDNMGYKVTVTMGAQGQDGAPSFGMSCGRYIPGETTA